MRRPPRSLALLALLLPAVAVAQAPSPAQAPPAAPAATWVPRGTVELTALDKVTARTSPLSGKVGQPLKFGSLTILARACVVRPPDQPADAAAFLEITDNRPGAAPFRGWMLLSAPSITVFEHPVYDIRLTGCR